MLFRFVGESVTDADRFRPRIRAALQTFPVDVATIDAIDALERNGVRSILLRGPAIAQWLYDQESPRTYSDADLLVAPDSVADAATVLEGLGYQRGWYSGIQDVDVRHADSWTRAAGGANIDLHWRVEGIGAPSRALWQVWSRETEWIVVAGKQVEVLGVVSRCVMVALHAAQHPWGKATDVQKALERAAPEQWEAALEQAKSLDALDAFVVGLRTTAQGRALADRWGLYGGITPEWVLRQQPLVPLAVGLAELDRTPGWRAKASVLKRVILPPPWFIRTWFPRAKKGRIWILIGYLARIIWVIKNTPRAVVAWRRARSQAARGVSNE